MRVLRTFVAAVVLAVAASPRSAPVEEAPAIEFHRTAEGAFFSPAKSKLLFVLVIGSDVREGDPKRGRADSLHVVAVNTKTGAGTIVGIPRDSYVPIPGSGADKINASLFFGGPHRTVDTVRRMSGLPIHYYALIEFSRFRKLVDTLDGVEVDVPYRMVDPASGANFNPGKKKMNGEQALAFSRARKTIPGGDFGRSGNQGRVLLGALKEFTKDAESPLSVAKYLRAFDDLVEADVPTSDLLGLAAIGRRLKPDKIRNVVLPGGGGNAGGASVVFLSGGAGEIWKKIRDDAAL